MHVMRIHKIEQIYSSNFSFCGKNNSSRLLENFLSRDIYSSASGKEFIELRNIYNNLWKKLELPENLKPRIQYKAMLSNMAFSIGDYMIYVEKRFSPFEMNCRNKSGKNESILRHEIEHVKQFWEIIRLIGADNMAKELKNNKGFNLEVNSALLKKMREIECTLGRITPLTERYTKAQQYLLALRNYPDTSQYYGIGVKGIIMHLSYKNNLLEKQARYEASKYKPTLIRALRVTINEFCKLILH